MKLTSILALNLLLYGPPEGLEDFWDSDFDSNTPQLQPEDLPKINASKMDTNSLRVSSSTMTDMNYVCADISHNIGTLFRVSVLRLFLCCCLPWRARQSIVLRRCRPLHLHTHQVMIR